MAASRCGHCAKATRRGPDKAAGWLELGRSWLLLLIEDAMRRDIAAPRFLV